MARRAWVGGNFKMNGTSSSIKEIIGHLAAAKLSNDVEVVVGVPFPYLALASSLVEKTNVAIAAQNAYTKGSGAFTGEVSTSMILDSGASWVILGHSERRHIFHETSEFVAEKVAFALENKLKVVLCVGETKEEREAGRAEAVVDGQLAAVIKRVDPSAWANIVIAYEPVWAIGTGLTATPKDAEDIHAHIRKFMSEHVNAEVSKSVRIVYGGSVTAKTAPELSEEADIDGFLVGGASLKPEFVEIVNTAKL